MRIVRENAGTLEIRGRDGVRAPILIGIWFLILPAGFWIANASAAGTAHLVALATLVWIGLLLILSAVARGQRVVVRERPPSITTTSAMPHVEVRPGSMLQLSEVPSEHGAGPSRYGVELLSPEGARGPLLLANDDPAIAIRDARKIAAALGVSIRSGWGAEPPAADWVVPPDPLHAPRPRSATEDLPDRRGIALACAAGALAVGIVLTFEVHARIERGDAPGPMSVVLPVLLVLGLVVLALLFGTERRIVSLEGSALVAERWVLGIRVGRSAIEQARIRDVRLVTAGGAVSHLLLDLDDGPRAIECEWDAGRDILARIAPSGPRHPVG